MLERPQLGRILLSHGLIAEGQLTTALEYQKEKPCRLGEALVALELCSELDIARALSEQMEIPFIDLQETPPSPRLLRLIPRDVAVEYGILPVRMEGDRLVVAARNPLDIRVDEVVRQTTRMAVIVASALQDQITALLSQYDQLKWSPEPRTGAPLAPRPSGAPALRPSGPTTAPAPGGLRSAQIRAGLPSAGDDSKVVQQINSLLADAVRKGASDVCFESQKDGVQVRARIDGHMYSIGTLPEAMTANVFTRLRAMSGTAVAHDRKPHQGTCQVRVDGNMVAFRSSIFSAVQGEVVVLRVANTEKAIPTLDKLGLDPEMERELRCLLLGRQGLLLVSGPIDSGKSTTLYSLLQHLDSDASKILTVEDTVETHLPGIHQYQRADHQGPSYHAALSLALGQLPDVVMAAELPDRQAAEAGCRAAMEGRLVLAGSLAPHALRAITRLYDLGVPAHTAAASISAVLSQRLVRRVCEDCAVEHKLPFEMERALEATFGSLEGARFRKGRGCNACHGHGTRGRTGVYEMIVVDEDLRYLMSERVAPSVIQEHIAKQGYRSLEWHAFRKACSGVIAPEELISLRLTLAAAIERSSAKAGAESGESMPSLLEGTAADAAATPTQEDDMDGLASWEDLAAMANSLG